MFMMVMMMNLCDIINIYITLPCRQPLVANLRALCFVCFLGATNYLHN